MKKQQKERMRNDEECQARNGNNKKDVRASREEKVEVARHGRYFTTEMARGWELPLGKRKLRELVKGRRKRWLPERLAGSETLT